MEFAIAGVAGMVLVALYIRRRKRLDNARYPGLWR